MVIINNQEDSADFHENVKPDTRYCSFFAELIDSSLYFNKNSINTGEEPDEYTY
jgi:hypothetical protein